MIGQLLTFSIDGLVIPPDAEVDCFIAETFGSTV